MTSNDTTETVATYTIGTRTYEIDHLGIAYDSQWGEFAVYCGGNMIAEFSIPQAGLRPEFRPDTLPPDEELIRLAKQAVALEEAVEVLGD